MIAALKPVKRNLEQDNAYLEEENAALKLEVERLNLCLTNSETVSKARDNTNDILKRKIAEFME